MEPGAPPDLRDVEQKLGRKVPESLARPLRGEEHPGRAAATANTATATTTEPARGPAAAPGPRRRRAAALARLETKLHLLRQEMQLFPQFLTHNLLGQTPYYFLVGMRISLAACGGGFMQLSWNSATQSEQSNLILCKQVQCYTIVPVLAQPHIYISKRLISEPLMSSLCASYLSSMKVLNQSNG
ncbi:leucine rich adaptor protein 1-like isoform X3 [Oxyura jamaicensis]|uniref:leucine rich adaptor protein 1-like isoform X3 n=1 Tax=Oxyura jamaicensis TaxID=8884 RepID=UPI0015A66B57|nr:leucine rich adaptor protein 1-like isoform X3 [Oxyura jamaicensis]